MALRDGMVPYNDNPQGLSSLLKPQLKNTNFQLLAALGSSWQLLAALGSLSTWPSGCPAPAVSCSAATLVVAAVLLLLRLLQLVATSFSQQIASKNTPPGRENIMALRDGMVPYNDNPQGLSSLLKPQLKNTNFQLLAALGSLSTWPSCCPAPAVSCSAATLVVAAVVLLLRLLQLFATSFSQQIAAKNAPPGRENTMALRDGMVPCNDNPWGLTSLLKLRGETPCFWMTS